MGWLYDRHLPDLWPASSSVHCKTSKRIPQYMEERRIRQASDRTQSNAIDDHKHTPAIGVVHIVGQEDVVDGARVHRVEEV